MLKPIKNNKQYDGALARIYSLMQKDIKANSADSDELEVLSILVKQYEQGHYPVPKPRPLEANLSMIRKLSERLHIPAEVLIQVY
jgi:HTH-type transcriptional regulator/antitoxin HigA